METSREGPESGLGIGLALAKGLVERHGGTISAQSAGLGHGSEFIVTLPIVSDSLPSTASGQHTAVGNSTGGRGLRVMVADDNVDAAESLSLILSARGHEVRAAFDGTQAVELAAEFRPHVAVLDIGMPGLTGY